MTPVNKKTFHEAGPPSQNKFIWLCVLAAITLVGTFFGMRMYVDYTRTLRSTEDRLLTQTRIIDENIATNLTVVNLLLNNIVAKQKDTSGGQLHIYLKQQLDMTPGIRTLIITDSQGRCIYSNRDELLGKDFPKNRDYFKVPRDAPDKGMLFLSPPYTTILGKYVINISKPLTGQHGEFNGIVSVTLDPEYFSGILSSTIYKPDNRVSLVHSDGTVFIAVPEAQIPVTGIKVTQPGSAFLHHISGGKPSSVRVSTGKTIGDKRIFAYRTTIPKGVRFDRQIIVAASRNLHEVLRVWRMDAAIEAAVFLLFASSSIVITRVMLHRGIELKRLEETREHLAAIVEFSDDAIISKDMNGVILSWNYGAERLFGYTPDEAVGQSITMLIPHELQKEENQIIESLKAGEPLRNRETVRIAKNGQQIDVSVTSSPLRDSTGTVIGASKIIRDITERKLAEQKLLESQAQLQAAHSRLQIASEELVVQNEELEVQTEELHNQNQELQGLWERSRQAEASLLESRHDLDRAQEVGSIGSWRLNVRINVLTWSDENYRIFGIPIGTPLTYETFLSTIHPDDLHYVNTRWNAGLRGEPYDIEHRLLVNEQVKWVREKAYLEFEEDGTLIGGFGITQDITARKQAEEALRESEFFFKESQRAASIGSYKTDLITGKWESSEVLDAIFGIDQEYTRSLQGWLDLVHPDDRDMMDHYLREEVIAKKTLFSKEYRIIRKNDGEARWVLGLGEVTFDGNDTLLSLIGTIQDITGRKQTEDELAAAHRQNQSIIDNTPAIVYAFDLEERFVLANTTVAELLNSTPPQMIGKRRHDFMPHADADWHEANDRKVIEAGRALDFEEQSELPDRSITWLTTKFPLRDAAGRIYAVGGISTDITDRKSAERALKTAHNELELRVAERTKELAALISQLQNEIRERELAEESLLKETTKRIQAVEVLREKEQMLIQQSRQAAMGEMIGNIAHQWRQPLNTLGLYTQKLGMIYGTPGFNQELLDNSISKSMEIIKHMSKTIDDFRDYFKPEREKTDFHLIDAIKSTLSLLEGNFHNPKITVDFVEHDNPVIRGYQNEFSQVFLNILNNARDAIIEREIDDARVSITICSAGSCAVVTVADNAGGIPDEIIDKVFDPYFTTKGPQLGTGIGLFMSKTIIEKNMGGRLTVRNTGSGAEFRIEVEHGN